MIYQVKLTTYAKGEVESVYLWHKRYDRNWEKEIKAFEKGIEQALKRLGKK